jgi:hypothetical protein
VEKTIAGSVFPCYCFYVIYVIPEPLTTVIGKGKEKYFDGFIKRVINNLNATDTETIAGGKVILSGNTELADGQSGFITFYHLTQRMLILICVSAVPVSISIPWKSILPAKPFGKRLESVLVAQ